MHAGATLYPTLPGRGCGGGWRWRSGRSHRKYSNRGKWAGMSGTQLQPSVIAQGGGAVLAMTQRALFKVKFKKGRIQMVGWLAPLSVPLPCCHGGEGHAVQPGLHFPGCHCLHRYSTTHRDSSKKRKQNQRMRKHLFQLHADCLLDCCALTQSRTRLPVCMFIKHQSGPKRYQRETDASSPKIAGASHLNKGPSEDGSC